MNTSTSVSIQPTSETELLSFLLGHAHDHAVAFWRLPNNSVVNAILANHFQRLTPESTVEELPSGFIFAPFDHQKPRYFLPADYTFSFENSSLRPAERPDEVSSLSWLSEQLKSSQQKNNIQFSPRNTTESETAKSSFLELVHHGLAQIENGTLEKVVPSRTKHIQLPENFNPVSTFQRLCKLYPNALVSFVSIPEVGHWIGASPEILVSVEDKTIFKTVALAGTKPYQEGTNLKNVAWTQKEIEEQALVERYIISCFKKIRLREYEEHGPKTVVAGNLMHLRSDFTVDMQATSFPQLGSVMLQLLHPTSAVCGMPLNSAMDFLKKHEGYDREFYSGYLGPVNFRNALHLFVNLRCMQLFDQQAILYAGAGITIDSLAEQEWEETEMKFQTLLNAINPS